MKPRFSLLFVLFLTSSFVLAQTKDETVLDLEGEGLSVVGTVELNQQVQSLDHDQIVAAQAPDVPALLEKTLGLAVTRNGGYGSQASVSLRGFGSGRVAILIDGVPVNSTQSGDFDLSRVQVQSLRKVEVISGGSDTKYNINGAIGGVINLITVAPREPGIRFGGSLFNQAYYPGAGGSSYLDTQGADFEMAVADEERFFTLGFSGHRAANEYPFVDEDKANRRWTGNGVADAGISSTLGWSFPDERRLLVSANAYYGNKNVPGPVNSATPGKQTDLSTRTSVVWTDASVGLDSLSTNLTLSHRLSHLDWTDPTIHSLHNLNTLGVINRWDWVVAPWLTVQTGADLDYSLLSSNTVGNLQDYSGGIYATLPLTPHPQGEIVPSVKIVVAQDLATPIPVPKLGLVYRFGERFTVKNNYFRTFKLPSINDRYWPEDAFAKGNPNLKSEDGVGSDLIVAGQVGRWLSFESSWYATQHQNAIAWQPAGGKWKPTNIGKAFYQGSGNSVKGEVGPNLTLTASYSYLMTWVLTDGLAFADNIRMPYKPVHTAGFGVDYRWTSGSASVTGHFESERFISTANLTALPAFFTLDASVDQRMSADWTLFCNVKNLLNQSYSSVDGYPMPGGSVTVGVRYSSSALPITTN